MTALAILEPGDPVHVELVAECDPVAFLRAEDGTLWATAEALVPFLGYARRASVLTLADRNAGSLAGHWRFFALRCGAGLRRWRCLSEVGAIVLLFLADTDKARKLREAAAQAIVARQRRARASVSLPPVMQLRALLDDARDEAKAIGKSATTADERGTFADADDLLGEARQVTEVAGALAGSDFQVPLGGYGMATPLRARATFLRLLGGDDTTKRGDR